MAGASFPVSNSSSAPLFFAQPDSSAPQTPLPCADYLDVDYKSASSNPSAIAFTVLSCPGCPGVNKMNFSFTKPEGNWQLPLGKSVHTLVLETFARLKQKLNHSSYSETIHHFYKNPQDISHMTAHTHFHISTADY